MKSFENARKKDLIIIITLNVLLASLAGIYWIIFDTDTPLFTCSFYEKTSLPCPACGGSRALFSLLRLKLISSFLYYPPLFVAIALIIKWDILSLLHVFSTKERKPFNIRRTDIIALPAAVILFFVIRIILLYAFGFDLSVAASSLNF